MSKSNKVKNITINRNGTRVTQFYLEIELIERMRKSINKLFWTYYECEYIIAKIYNAHI